MKNRLKQLRKELGLTQSDFASRLDMAQNSYSQIENGRATLTDKNITLVCLRYGISEHWLRTGEGEMMNGELNLSPCGKRLLDLFMALSPRAQDILIEYAEKILADEQVLRGKSSDQQGIRSAPAGYPLGPLSNEGDGFEEERSIG
ncbi:MAG: helix-turn-helix domain-containing protein [Treponema sp.]|jgi:transcriptional regulator with XRE-family HTH domain|nr:helix-turn-helix domain-containing protein [Treponema sp.]